MCRETLATNKPGRRIRLRVTSIGEARHMSDRAAKPVRRRIEDSKSSDTVKWRREFRRTDGASASDGSGGSRPVAAVVTAPHAACLSARVRDCDRVAAPAAALTTVHLLRAGLPARLVIGDVPRLLADLNRASTRWRTQFRARVRAALTAAAAATPGTRTSSSSGSGGIALLDVHSFPEPHSFPVTEFGAAGPEVVVLDNWPGTAWARDLVLHLRRVGVRAALLAGSRANDIVEEARTRGASAVLVEFSERLPYDRLDAVAAALAEFVSAGALLEKKKRSSTADGVAK